MTFVWGDGLVVASAVALLALGGWAVTLKPRRIATVAFAVYALGLGFTYLVFWVPRAFERPDWAGASSVVVITAITVPLWAAVLALAAGLPRPLRRDEWRLLVRPAVLAAAFVAATSVWWWATPSPHPQWGATFLNWTMILFAAALGLERVPSSTPAERPHLALMSSALLLVVAEIVGRALVGRAAASLDPVIVVGGAAILAIAAGWLVTGERVPGAGPLARNVALITTGAMAFSAFWAFWAGDGPGRHASLGVVMLVGAVLLARGALVGGLLGVEVQLRWGISKSTIAAVFIAVFFVASEGAQLLFGAGNAWAGLLAAGALVFALAPLQRAAERLAERAVPVAGGSAAAAPGRSRAVETYRRAVRLALRDRRLSVEEEIELAHVADGLGLSAAEATCVRHEIEREKGAH